MYGYLFNGFFNGGLILSGSAEGLFQNRHIKDLLEEGLEPTEVDWGRELRRRWSWCPGEIATRNPDFWRPVRWRRDRGAPEVITFNGAVFTPREWKKGNAERRRARHRASKREEPQHRPSFTFLLRRRAEEEGCNVAKLLLQQLYVTRRIKAHRGRWDGSLDLMRDAMHDAGWQRPAWPFEVELPYPPSFQSFWEWWAEHIHPRL